jgi:hypothetical protein
MPQVALPQFLSCPYCGAQGQPDAVAVANARTGTFVNGRAGYRCPSGHQFAYHVQTGQVQK